MVRVDWDAWNKRGLAGENVVRLILDGTVVRVRLDCKASNISVLVVFGVRRDGQKVLLAVKLFGGAARDSARAASGIAAEGARARLPGPPSSTT